MGEVYRARDSRLGRQVAVKIISEDNAESPDSLRRFDLEARAVAALNHPHILSVHDVGTEDGTAYVVFELLEGETLRARLGRGPLPPRKAVELAVQVCAGLAAAHARGIIHRDLKPDNLFVTKGGHAKILDFGLAKLTEPLGDVEGTPTRTRTARAAWMGTVGYVSPEQLRAGRADARSDLFALGATLYEMLAGQPAFRGQTSADTLSAILGSDPPPIDAAVGPVPASLERVVRRCLEKDPEERFQSARDVGFALEAVAGSGSTEGAVVEMINPTSPKWIAATALAVFAAAGASVLTMWAARRQGDRSPPKFTQLTFRPGTVTNARFTKDGHTVVYSALWDGGVSEIFSRDLDQPNSVPLGLPPARLLSVSSRGELAILLPAFGERGMAAPGTLARVPQSGGSVRTVLNDVLAADWSPDGNSLAVVRWLGGQLQMEYPIGTVLLRPCQYANGIRVSPKGDSVALDSPQGVLLVDHVRGARVLSEGWVGGFAWSSEGDSLLVAGGDPDSFYATRVVRRLGVSGEKRDLCRIPGQFFIHDRTADGRVLLHHGLERWGDRVRPPGAAEENEVAVSAWSFVAGLSADGTQVLIDDVHERVPGTAVLRGNGDRSVLRLGEGRPGGLSPDGRWALIIERTGQAMLTPTGTGQPVPVSLGRLERAFEHHAGTPEEAWHVDEHGVGFSAAEAGRPRRSFFVALPGGEPRAITPEGTLAIPDVLPGGRVVGISSDGALALYPLAGGDARPLPARLALRPFTQPLRVSGEGRFLYVRDGEIPARVDRLDLESGERSAWRSLASKDPVGNGNIFAISLTPGGDGYAYTYGQYLQDLFLVEGLPF
jgi:hypothetical protein